MKIKSHPSPNFNERISVDKPEMIIMHYTGMESAEAALIRLCDPYAEVSAHYLIDEKGQIIQMVDDSKRAWHAGKSYWKNKRDINSISIGIELANSGHEFNYTDFSEPQILSLIKLTKILMNRYQILPANILAHSDIAPSRKLDPGHLFPWQRLANIGIGIWSEPDEADKAAAQDLVQTPEKIHDLLRTYGYNPDEKTTDIITAFHRHYAPEKFKTCHDNPDQIDVQTLANLLALIRQSDQAAAGIIPSS